MTTTTGTPALPGEVDVAIVGSGFSGLGMAIQLKRDGVEDFLVLERERGRRRHLAVQHVSGCGCDVPSHLYSFSFAPNPGWTRSYPSSREILAYLRGSRGASASTRARG